MDEFYDTDNLSPNDSTFLHLDISEEQKVTERLEKTKAIAAAPLIRDTLAWFDDCIAHAETIKGIDPESNVSVEAQIMAKQTLAALLKTHRSEFQRLADTYL